MSLPMKYETFRYKGMNFPYNPQSLTVKRERRLVRLLSPFSGTVVQDLGPAPVVISGKGELCGDQAAEQLAAIAALFQSEGTGLLQLPGLPALRAWFSAFQSEETAGLPLVRYTFTFVADSGEGESL